MAITTEEQARQAKALSGLALTVLVGRAGGSIEFTAAEFSEIVERYGGKGRATLIAEELEEAGQRRFTMKLVSKQAGQGELPV